MEGRKERREKERVHLVLDSDGTMVMTWLE